MPRCPICDGENFEEIDGRYYCDECHTESQDVRELQQEAGYVDPSLRTRRLRETGTPTKKGLTLEESYPWYTHEAFQVIIKAQVDTLVKMGVSPRLKDIVKQLWFSYLSRCGVAFTGVAQEHQPHTQDGLTFRQQDRMTSATHRRKTDTQAQAGEDKGSEGESTDAGSTHDPLSSQASARSDLEPIDDIDMYIRGVSGPETETSDTSVYVTSDTDDDREDDRGSVDSRSSGTTRGKKRGTYPIQRMTMLRTLCFSYLGILWLQEPVLPSDIIRWVREGHIPYIAVKELLPKHMKLGIQDCNNFCVQAFPSYQVIQNNTARLARFLQLPPLPEVDFSRVTSRFILDLNLPAELHGLVGKLLTQRPIDPTLWCNRYDAMLNHEAIAMGLIIVVLKLLFGLDDNTERTLSETARELQSKEKPDVKLFVFEDWMSWAMERREQMTTRGLPKTDRAMEKIRDVEQYTDYYKEVIAKWKQNYRPKVRPRYEDAFLKKRENRDAVQRPFQSLASGSREQRAAPTSFPLSFGTVASMTTHSSPVDTDFKCHTLKYITDREDLWTAIRNYPTYPDFRLRYTGSNTGGGRIVRVTDQEHLHDTYEFVLGLCAGLIEQDKYGLHHYVTTLEKLLGAAEVE
ncbi:PREDICTED: TATA box-binding protein-associated factor RNA polymerase I subunit B-like [Branchiostoma belcheri]|uniref:TATA box-binding protein-associated factor RNA polymerase I subunit B n=1 Tax=Branchiostoma belcheri TaxID=7741 RepID=A0A6P4YWV0_BRABE|nr:PREDICTED: TATA box-binding protein-associated factor RNA polymerase I subunit B-like [Branchiostoma belcheri]